MTDSRITETPLGVYTAIRSPVEAAARSHIRTYWRRTGVADADPKPYPAAGHLHENAMSQAQRRGHGRGDKVKGLQSLRLSPAALLQLLQCGQKFGQFFVRFWHINLPI